ncbi:Stp1/IreP family PP2C-type Ser/Thr phosphatase [Planococcus salinus]|uniref:Stp1/IreP family PP2C-type Ser/Thr phosphatase n=1 Tax=Planococcus salinus TaxID=1848460 RepID=A0A3M8PAA7_9BACL|nr:Stp1/IreP family PP2C-type Ser/Thr phosphatase [Planococcus salinus]RNF40645.1 Stp1/IreP family PP2C-type Ser/Thr phosphatase [Planococcus salinus]
MFQYVAESDTGLKREVNEDRVAVLKRPEGLLLAVVADGMGGHNAGDVASAMTVEALGEKFLAEKADAFLTEESRKGWLSRSIQHVNRAVFDHAGTHPQCKGMGTTLIAAIIDHDQCTLCHIGDSRAYQIEDEVVQLTRDHSYVNVLVDSGEISEEEAEDHPKKNWIVKALGTEEGIEADFLQISLAASSYLLLCTDGLSNKVTKEAIFEIVQSSIPLAEKGEELVKLANQLGGEDNISLILLSSKLEEV